MQKINNRVKFLLKSAVLLCLPVFVYATSYNEQAEIFDDPNILHVGFVDHHQPVSFVNNNKEPDGIAIDVWNLIAGQNALQLHYTACSFSDEGNIDTNMHDNFDIFLSAIGNIERKNEYYYETESYVDLPFVFLAKNTPEESDGNFESQIFGVMRYCTVDLETMVADYAPGSELQYFYRFDDLLDAYDAGDIQGALFVQASERYAFDRLKADNIGFVSTPFTLPLKIFVNKNLGTEYVDALNQMIASVSPTMIDSIVSNHTNSFTLPITLQRFLSYNSMYIFPGFGIIIIIVSALFYGYKRIKFLKIEAEFDGLTKLFNKTAINRRIEEYLSVEKVQNGALFIIDSDNFKAVNDTFGHAFGDTVLAHISDSLKKVFRVNDLVGRIGGDEFMAFISNFTDKNVPIKKAEEIHRLVKKQYSKGKKTVDISVSIGIAYVSEDCKTFVKLFEHADEALYDAKAAGKNCHSVFDEKKAEEKYNRGQHNRKPVDKNLLAKTFNILHSTEDYSLFATALLQLLTEHFDFSRGFLFELSDDGKHQSCVYEWCKEGIPLTKDTMQNMKLDRVRAVAVPSVHEKYLIIDDQSVLSEDVKQLLSDCNVKYVINFGIWNGEKPIGFIGFADIEKHHDLSIDEINELGRICRMGAMFFSKSSGKN
ncbi:MAG: GGDEF domain-containing protein [Spirochaetales bacterium]